jgi:hypothetical protein
MSEPLVHGWFLLQIAVLLVVGAFVVPMKSTKNILYFRKVMC